MRHTRFPSVIPLVGTLLGALAPAVVGCGQKGTVTFTIDAPAVPQNEKLSPLADARRDFVSLFDEISGMAVGPAISATAPSGEPQSIGELPAPHHYDFQMRVEGGGKLIGLARTPNFNVVPGETQNVTLSVRKLLLFYQSQHILAGAMKHLPQPGALMAIDTTLPQVPQLPNIDLPDCKTPDACPGVSAVTADGLSVLVALPGRLLLLPSSKLYDAGGAAVLATATIPKAAGMQKLPLPQAIEMSPDSKAVAIVTDQGVNVTLLSELRDGAVLPNVDLASATALAWKPDGTAVAVLTGPTASSFNCRAPQPAAVQTVSLADPTHLSTPQAGPPAATSIAFAPDGTLIFAAPCSGGVLRTGDNVPLLAGVDITDVLVAGGRIFAVSGTLKIHESDDPDNPIFSSASVLVSDGSGPPTARDFQVPGEPVALGDPGDPSHTTPQLQLQPARLVAYDLALTPDATHLLVASRATYRSPTEKLLQGFNVSNRQLTSWCTLSVVRDVYRLSEIDLASGDVQPETVFGLSETTACTFACFDCNQFGFGCKQRLPPPPSCARSDGFVPGGMSIVFGSD